MSAATTEGTAAAAHLHRPEPPASAMGVEPRTRSVLGTVVAAPIRLYQRWISPALPPRCRYAPTCSAYAVEALHTHGPVKGLVLAAWRLLRCNPWSRGGVDLVPERGTWRARPWQPPADWPGHHPSPQPVPMGMGEPWEASGTMSAGTASAHTPTPDHLAPSGPAGVTTDAQGVTS